MKTIANGIRYDRKNLLSILLHQIQHEQQQIRQWVTIEDYSRTMEHSCQLEALVETLEIYDCGSVGGFNPEQVRQQKVWSLNDRAEWLLAKYGPLAKCFLTVSPTDLEKLSKPATKKSRPSGH